MMRSAMDRAQEGRSRPMRLLAAILGPFGAKVAIQGGKS